MCLFTSVVGESKGPLNAGVLPGCESSGGQISIMIDFFFFFEQDKEPSAMDDDSSIFLLLI